MPTASKTAQNAISSSLVEEAFNLLVSPGQRETGPVQNIVFNRGKGGRGVVSNLAVKGVSSFRKRVLASSTSRSKAVAKMPLSGRPLFAWVMKPQNALPKTRDGW